MNLHVLLLALFGVAAKPALPAAMTPPPMTVTGAFFALSVADLEASTRWYADSLGLRVVMQEPKRDKAAVAVLEGGGLIVELIQDDDAVPLAKAAPGVKSNIQVHGLVKAGVVVADFDKALAVLKERQVKIAFGPYPARPNQRANVIIEDNAGNLIQLFGRETGAP
jgi:catechol 2,3-dioxygenase-like lactoylglutathione lyase family enzyme